MKAAERKWYVVRTKPGASRQARERIVIPDWRREENEAERELRDAGFFCHFPRMRKEITHHRTKKKVVRAFPLFTGYVFVDMASNRMDFDILHAMRFIGAPLGINREAGVRALPRGLVEDFMAAEENLEFDDTREARIRRKQEGRTRKETIKMTFPVGDRVTVKGGQFGEHPFSGFHGEVVSVEGRGTVQVMIELFGGLVPCEFDPQNLEAAE